MDRAEPAAQVPPQRVDQDPRIVEQARACHARTAVPAEFMDVLRSAVLYAERADGDLARFVVSTTPDGMTWLPVWSTERRMASRIGPDVAYVALPGAALLDHAAELTQAVLGTFAGLFLDQGSPHALPIPLTRAGVGLFQSESEATA